MGQSTRRGGSFTVGERDRPAFGSRQRPMGFCPCPAIRWYYPGRFSDSEELAAFCAICGAKTLRGPASALAETAARLNWPIQSRQILSAVGVLRPTPIPPGICEPSPREVYPLLQGVFDLPEADFAPWYCEVSHKLRHQQGTLLGVPGGRADHCYGRDLSSKQTSGSDWVGSDSSGFSQARICGGAGVSAGGPRAGKR